MHLHQLFGRQCLGAFENLPRLFVATAHLPFLFVSQRHNAEAENLVNFGIVKEVTRAFRRHLRIVVENDWRREHRIALLILAQNITLPDYVTPVINPPMTDHTRYSATITDDVFEGHFQLARRPGDWRDDLRVTYRRTG